MAAVDAAPLPVIAPHVATPLSYHQHYGDAANDPYQQDYASVMLMFRADNEPLEGDVLLHSIGASDATHPNNYIGLFEVEGVEGGRSMLISGIQRYAALAGRPTPWDLHTYGFAGDVVQGEIPTVRIPENAFQLTRGATATTVPGTAERVDELWAALPPGDELIGPFDPVVEEQSRQVRTRFLMYVPPLYVPIVAGRRLSPSQLWIELAGAIRANDDAANCAQLLDWIMLSGIRRVVNAASSIKRQPFVVPLSDASLIMHRQAVLRQQLPGLRTINGAGGAGPGNLPPQQQNTVQFSETAIAGLELMAEDYTARKRTIVLSAATYTTMVELMDSLKVPENGASWPNKPTGLPHIDGFSWQKSTEDSDENRTAYMAYLKNLLQIPAEYDLADVQPKRSLLSVDIPDIRKLSGTTDVAIAKTQHVCNAAIRNHIETLLELKKPKNMQEKDHTPQAIGEHFAASYLNPNRAVVSVLTDLNHGWTFFWFARDEEEDSQIALYTLRLTGIDATAYGKYILDSLFENSVGGTLLPTTFADRQPFQAVLDSVVVRNKRGRREFDGADSDDSQGPASKPSPSGGADQHPTSGTDASTSSRGGAGTAHENNQGAVGGGGGGAPMSMASALSLFAPPTDRDVANELDLLDMVDESEQYEIVRSFVSKHIVPFMTG